MRREAADRTICLDDQSEKSLSFCFFLFIEVRQWRCKSTVLKNVVTTNQINGPRKVEARNHNVIATCIRFVTMFVLFYARACSNSIYHCRSYWVLLIKYFFSSITLCRWMPMPSESFVVHFLSCHEVKCKNAKLFFARLVCLVWLDR